MDENQLKFVVYCITELSNELKITKAEAYKLLNDSNIIDDLLLRFYDEMHSYGSVYIVNELLDALRIKGYLK
jgi:hypothetical protein